MGAEFKSVKIGVKEKRYVITDDASPESDLLITTNLRENELQMDLLQVDRCPLGQPCVNKMGEASSICEYMGIFPFQFNPTEQITKQVQCLYDDRFSFPEITTLSVRSCPLELSNCISCEFLERVMIPPKSCPKKSHACVICRSKTRLPD